MKIVAVSVLRVHKEIQNPLKVSSNPAKESDNKDMGMPFGKASGRTFLRNKTPLPLTNWSSSKVKSSDHTKNVKTTAFRSLEGRLAHV